MMGRKLALPGSLFMRRFAGVLLIIAGILGFYRFWISGFCRSIWLFCRMIRRDSGVFVLKSRLRCWAAGRQAVLAEKQTEAEKNERSGPNHLTLPLPSLIDRLR